MEKQFENAQKQILLLRYQHDEMEQYSRRESIRVFGVEGNTAEETDEDLITKSYRLQRESTSLYNRVIYPRP